MEFRTIYANLWTIVVNYLSNVEKRPNNSPDIISRKHDILKRAPELLKTPPVISDAILHERREREKKKCTAPGSN